MPNLPTDISPTKIRRLEISEQSPMDMRILPTNTIPTKIRRLEISERSPTDIKIMILKH